MHTDLSQFELKSIWKQAVRNELKQTNLIRPVIAESWKRCLQYKINPFNRTIPILTQDELGYRIEENLELLQISTPIMDKLHQFVRNSGFIVAIADSKGTLLYIIGDQEVKTAAEGGDFAAGADWREEIAGTNAIGTVIKTGQPLQIFGSEHFCLVSHRWTCSSSPIFDPDGVMVGILDITGTFEKVHTHTLGMVVTAANAIENQLLLRRTLGELEVTNNYKNTIIDSISEGLLAVDSKMVITHVNMAAARIFSGIPDEIINKPLKSVLSEKNRPIHKIVDEQKVITDQEIIIIKQEEKIRCLLTSRPIFFQNKSQGIVLLFNEIDRVHKLIQHMSGSEAKLTFNDILGVNKDFLNIIGLAKAISGTTSNILLLGESGTGKDIFAQAIHNESIRCNGPFVAINCGAIPRELITSELFGYSEGSFTGAKRGGKPGKFELTHNGTIFLDEIGEMPLELQPILLRVLEQKTVTRIGGSDIIPVDVRVIAASNKNLLEEVTKGNFRQDLYYRLNVVKIDMIPLRERKEDIPLLAKRFFQELRLKLNKPQLKYIDDSFITVLTNYDWPGNVRELQNVLERVINVCQKDSLTEDDMPMDIRLPKPRSTFQPIETYERNIIKDLLESFDGNITLVANELGLARSTLYRKIYKYKLDYK